VTASAREFVDALERLDRQLRKAQQTIPSRDAKAEVTSAFWSFVDVMNACEARGTASAETANACRQIIGPWLFRSRYWNRAFHKPHGYPGDYRMVEWMYDLETDPCADPGQPGIVNCLDHLFATVHSVVSVWQRRAWFARLLQLEQERRPAPLRILDVAAGGARYMQDFLQRNAGASGVEVTLVDQDASALAFCRMQSLAPWVDQLRTVCGPIKQLRSFIPSGEYDLVMCAGLFDYLDNSAAAMLLDHVAAILAPNGTIAFSNFHPSDPSRLVKAWLVDWPLNFRVEDQCARLFPQHLTVTTSRPGNQALCYAQALAAT
jgi:extracellular factor (EF) 3-hydroxypalmitic acid methyl ester biosynthesis protein